MLRSSTPAVQACKSRWNGLGLSSYSTRLAVQLLNRSADHRVPCAICCARHGMCSERSEQGWSDAGTARLCRDADGFVRLDSTELRDCSIGEVRL